MFLEFTIFWLPLVYAPMIPAIYVILWNQPDLEITESLRTIAVYFLPGTILALVLAEIDYRIIAPETLIPEWSLVYLIFLVIVMVAFVGMVEELLFRGVIQRTLENRIGYWPGLLLASGLFGIMHSVYGSGWQLVFAGGSGLIFGLLYDRTNSILLVSYTHGCFNFFLFAVLPFYGSQFEPLTRILM